MRVNGLLECAMARERKARPREIFLTDWLEYFTVSQTRAAEIAGCTQSYISNIGRGARSNVNALFLLALSEELGITVNDMFRRPPSKAQVAQLQEYSPQAQTAILSRKRQRS